MKVRNLLLLAIRSVALLSVWLLLNITGVASSGAITPSSSESIQNEISTLNAIEDLGEFHHVFFLAYVNRFPEWVTSLRLFGSELDPSGHLLNDLSITRQQQDMVFVKSGLEKLRSFDFASQSPAQQLTTQVLGWFLEDQVRGEEFMFHDYRVRQLYSVHSDFLELMLDTHEVHTKLDAQNYIARLVAVENKFDQLIEILRTQKSLGIIAPKFILETVLQNLNPGDREPSQNSLYTSFVGKLAAADGLSALEESELGESAITAIANHVIPAFDNLRAEIEHQVTVATNNAGVWKLPDGDAYYAHTLRHHSTTDMTPQQIHDIGLIEVERIQTEIRGFISELGIGARDPNFGNVIRTYWGRYRGRPKDTYPDTAEGHQQALDDYTMIIREVEQQISGLFDVLPQAPVQVRAMPPEKAGAPAHYVPPSFDGSRPGTFFANVNPPPFKSEMRSLTFHEAVPGHHFQLALQMESDLALVQKVLTFNAHVEGWALYAEKLVRSIGMYPDLHSKIDNRWLELFRAARLVLDTGIHAQRWTRDEARRYAEDNLGFSLSYEVDRYIAWPGQAVSYKAGELKILELRKRVNDELGETFDIKAFHNIMLQYGQMPLSVLEKQVQLYIESAIGESN